MRTKEYPFNTGTASLNYVEVSTSGAPLVLLHGGTSRWQNFEVIMIHLTYFCRGSAMFCTMNKKSLYLRRLERFLSRI
jgi:hypothetical protein